MKLSRLAVVGFLLSVAVAPAAQAGPTTANNDVSVVLPLSGAKFWAYLNNATFQRLHNSLSPTAHALCNIDNTGTDDAIAGFASLGTFVNLNNTGTWTRRTTAVAGQIVCGQINNAGGEDAILTFQGATTGTWRLVDNGSFSKFHNSTATLLGMGGDIDGTPGDDALLVFDPAVITGTWIWRNNVSFRKIHADNASAIHGAGNVDANVLSDVLLSFDAGPTGTWFFLNNANYRKITNSVATLLGAGNIDGTGTNDALMTLDSPVGTWAFKNNATFQRFHASKATLIEGGQVDHDAGNRDEVVIVVPAASGTFNYLNNTSFMRIHSSSATQVDIGEIDGN